MHITLLKIDMRYKNFNTYYYIIKKLSKGLEDLLRKKTEEATLS